MVILGFPWNFHGFLSIYCEILNICHSLSGLCTSGFVLTSWVRERDHCNCLVFVFVSKQLSYLLHSLHCTSDSEIGSFDLRFVLWSLWSGFQSEYCINPQYIGQSSDFFNIFEDFILVYCEIFGFIRFIWCLSFPMSREFSVLQLSILKW